MKLANLVNLAPLKELEFDSPAPEGMDIPNFDSLVDALKWKNDLENYSMDLEHELKHAQRKFNDLLSGQGEMGAEPEGGPIQQKIAGELNQLKAREEELKKELETVLAKVDYFDQNYLSESQLNESTEKSWNAIDVSRKAEKEIDNKEWNERTTKKLDMLIALNKAGKFKKDWSEDKLQGWVDQNYSWEKISRQFKNVNEMKANKQKNLLIERFQELAGIKPLAETMQQGDYGPIERGWDGLPPDEQAWIIGDAKSGRADYSDLQKSFDDLKSEIPDFESIVAGYLGIDEGEDFKLEPEDMDNSDEDLVIIGSGYLDIKNKFRERPSQTNGEYAAKGQEFVDKLQKRMKVDFETAKEAALDYIYSQINEGSCGYGPDGVPGDTPGETQGMDADKRTKGMLKKFIQKEVKKLTVGKAPITKEGEQKPGDFDKGLKDLLGKDDFEKATSNEVPGLGDTVIDDKTDITTSKKTFMQMMMQFTDEPFLIETGLKLYDAWASGEGGLKPSRILDILKQSSNK